MGVEHENQVPETQRENKRELTGRTGDLVDDGLTDGLTDGRTDDWSSSGRRGRCPGSTVRNSPSVYVGIKQFSKQS